MTGYPEIMNILLVIFFCKFFLILHQYSPQQFLVVSYFGVLDKNMSVI